MPRKDVKMSGNLIQALLPTYGVEAVELSKREIKLDETQITISIGVGQLYDAEEARYQLIV